MGKGFFIRLFFTGSPPRSFSVYYPLCQYFHITKGKTMTRTVRRACMKGIRALVMVTRPKFLPLSVLPVALSAFMARQEGVFSWALFLWCLSGVVLLHAAGNAANDCYDYLLGADTADTEKRYSGGSGVIPLGLLSVSSVKTLTVVLSVASLAIALFVTQGRSPMVFLLALLGLGGGLFYTVPPLKLAYRGLGEIVVALCFGPGIMTGTYLVMSGTYSAKVFSTSAVVGFLIGAVLFLNELRDTESDRAAGKNTLAVRYVAWRRAS
jgi:1,4-dihydroxy-2-naphthoate octaprenyltransferase